VGAHKTATTYIQNTLLDNLEILKSQGISYIPLSVMRQEITKSIANKNVSAQELRALILKNSDYGKKLIISEENIMGGTGDLFNHNELYPEAKFRLKKIKEAFYDHNIYVFFSVREYSSYLSSMYCEFLRHYKKHITFEEYIKDYNLIKFSWDSIINEITGIFGHNYCSIIRFEDFIADNNVLFSYFFNQKIISQLRIREKESRPSFLNKTISHLNNLLLFENPLKIAKLKYNLNQYYKKQGETKKFNPWSEIEVEYFKNKYYEK